MNHPCRLSFLAVLRICYDKVQGPRSSGKLHGTSNILPLQIHSPIGPPGEPLGPLNRFKWLLHSDLGLPWSPRREAEWRRQRSCVARWAWDVHAEATQHRTCRKCWKVLKTSETGKCVGKVLEHYSQVTLSSALHWIRIVFPMVPLLHISKLSCWFMRPCICWCCS